MKIAFCHWSLTPLFAVALFVQPPRVVAQTVVNSDWIGDSSGNQITGAWSDAALWNPQSVPNNGGGNVYDVTIAWNPAGAQFNGPQLDVDVTIQNLTFINRGFLTNSNLPHNLTVTGTTTISTTAGHDGEYGGVFASGTYKLGTLGNYDAATQTLGAGFLDVVDNGSIQFRGADIRTNNGALYVSGPNASILNQDNGQSALTYLATNNGAVQFYNGSSFSTSFQFTNNGLLGVGGTGTTTFTVTGGLTNYDAGYGALYGGIYVVDGTNGTATLRFPNANIRGLYSGADVSILGANSRITDLQGNDAAFTQLRNIDNASLTVGRTLTITPFEGTLYNLNGGRLVITDGGNVTINGAYQQSTGGAVVFSPSANPTGNTSLTINGSHLVDTGGSIDMGGQPGVNTQYHTTLTVTGGLEFRGAFLTGAGTIIADTIFTQNATLSPGHSPGQLTFQGSLTLQSGTLLDMQIGGRAAGTEFDQVVQVGELRLTLGGTLRLTFFNGFENSITAGDTFDIVHSDHTLLGTFDNVASGQRLTTDDGLGSFLVTYDGNDVYLSDFRAVPEPATWVLIAAGLGTLVAFQRRASSCQRR